MEKFTSSEPQEGNYCNLELICLALSSHRPFILDIIKMVTLLKLLNSDISGFYEFYRSINKLQTKRTKLVIKHKQRYGCKK